MLCNGVYDSSQYANKCVGDFVLCDPVQYGINEGCVVLGNIHAQLHSQADDCHDQLLCSLG